MTEIPEHLLKRSRDRRASAADSGANAESESTSPAVASPSKAVAQSPVASGERSAEVEPAAPPTAPPDSAVVVAAKSRKRIPFWAMAAIVLLPVWAFMYARSVTQSAEEAIGPLGEGGEVYGGCASCHGGSGDGGVGYAFTGGEVLATFPNIEDQIRFVYFGTSEYNLADITSYGDPDREGGARATGELGVMPQQGEEAGGSLHDYEILAVVCHERYVLGGADPDGAYAEEFEQWCSAESEIFHALEGGEQTLASIHEIDESILPIGDTPVEGSPAQSE